MTAEVEFDKDHPVIPFIKGDGIGPEIWEAVRVVFDAAVKTVSKGEKRVEFEEIPAGEKSFNDNGSWLPEESLERSRSVKLLSKDH